MMVDTPATAPAYIAPIFGPLEPRSYSPYSSSYLYPTYNLHPSYNLSTYPTYPLPTYLSYPSPTHHLPPPTPSLHPLPTYPTPTHHLPPPTPSAPTPLHKHVVDEAALTEGVEYLLCLRLEDGKFYIEKTRYPGKRLSQHKEGVGCRWTSEYPVVNHFITECTCPEAEFKLVEEYMVKYGVDNVRGGKYTSFKLSNGVLQSLKKQLRNRF